MIEAIIYTIAVLSIGFIAGFAIGQFDGHRKAWKDYERLNGRKP